MIIEEVDVDIGAYSAKNDVIVCCGIISQRAKLEEIKRKAHNLRMDKLAAGKGLKFGEVAGTFI